MQLFHNIMSPTSLEEASIRFMNSQTVTLGHLNSLNMCFLCETKNIGWRRAVYAISDCWNNICVPPPFRQTLCHRSTCLHFVVA